MTVWLVAQPTGGLLIERSLARLIGTICGAIVGGLILILGPQSLPAALILLGFWLALCAGFGTIFRQFRNYGFVLAGYTAGIVVLFGLGDGQADFFLARDRILCTLIGVICSALLSFRALPSQDTGGERCARGVLDHVLRLVEDAIRGDSLDPDPSVVSEIGAFARAIDEQAAGSIRRHVDVLRLRHISGILLELVALVPRERGSITDVAFTQLEDPMQRALRLAECATELGRPHLARALEDLIEALKPDYLSARSRLRFDFDVSAAYRAAARPVLALALAAAIWLVTGWQASPMMAMTAVLFTSLFSSHDNGNHMVIQVLLGTVAGAATGSLARIFLLPHADAMLPMLSCVMPFLLFAAWLMRQPATAKMAIDMAMTFLLTAQPGTAPAAAGYVFSEAVAIVSGVLIAVAIFWLILPSTPAVRRELLARRIARLTAHIARSADRQTLAASHEMLRSAQVRLVDFTEAESPLFVAAQACLAAAAGARSQQSSSTRQTALQASAALDALIASNIRRKCNA